MTEHDPVLDAVFEAARAGGAPALAEEVAARAVRRAAAEGARLHRSRQARRRVLALAAAAAAAALAFGAGLRVARHRDERGPETFHAVLPTGDAITATAGSDLRVEEVSPEVRRVALGRGAALFEVARLGEGGRFLVVTDQAEVLVTGTVFSVEARSGRTAVRVYEGSVEVRRQGRAVAVGEGRMWESGAGRVATLEPGPLAAEAGEAARRRSALASAPPSARSTAPAGRADPIAVPPEEAALAPEEPPPARDRPAASPLPDRPAPPREDAGGRAAPARDPDLAEVRRWLAARRFDEALPVIGRAVDQGREPGVDEWRLAQAVALRGLGRSREAADLYDAVAQSPAGRAAGAGYLAASLRLRSLGDPEGALASLEASAADRPGSPLEERALALRARALDALGRAGEAREAARRYLGRYPDAGAAPWMRELARD